MERRPLWLWPNLLSLDAPLVAVAWMWMFAKTWQVVWFPHTLYLFVFGVVWGIYVADRLIDTRIHPDESVSNKPRHRFHAKHRQKFLIGLLVVGAGCLWTLINLPVDLWGHGCLVLLCVAGYFLLAFVQNGRGVSYVKNVLAGLAFAYGVSVGIHFYRPGSNLFWLVFSPQVLAFAVLCIANITAIDCWEQDAEVQSEDEKAANDIVISLLLFMLTGFALLLATKAGGVEKAVGAEDFAAPFFIAVMVGATLLYVVNRVRNFLSPNATRVLADLAMLLPCLVFAGFVLWPWLRQWLSG